MSTARIFALAASLSVALGASTASGQATDGTPIAWPDSTGADCPFPRSTRIGDVRFTGRVFVAPDSGADTWYPSWASDGSLYSSFTDGTAQGVFTQGYSTPAEQQTGYARIDGDDPRNLQLHALGAYRNNPTPYAGRYPSASLVYDGVWYYGTYTLDDLNGACHNWCTQGPFVGFRRSSDGGSTWTDTKYTPDNSVFGESGKNGGKVKFGPVHMVDFGKNMEHSPDGRAYFVSHGAVGANGVANWIGGDAVYLGRVTPTPAEMDDRAAFEFYGDGTWSHAVADAKPILLWPGRLGSVTVTYDAPARAYLMWVSRPQYPNNNTGPFDTLLLEADQITGPYRIVTTWTGFGPQAYFVNVPSKFISQDGTTMWLLYSANFASGGSNPPGSGYDLGLHELTMSITGHPAPSDAGIAHEAGASDAAHSAPTDARAEAEASNGAGGSKPTASDAARAPSADVEVSELGDDAEPGAADASGCACRASRRSDDRSAGAYAFVGLAIALCRFLPCVRRRRATAERATPSEATTTASSVA